MVFAVIGLALFAEVVGYYYDTYFFWALFILGYLAVLVGFIVHTYYHGMFRWEREGATAAAPTAAAAAASAAVTATTKKAAAATATAIRTAAMTTAAANKSKQT